MITPDPNWVCHPLRQISPKSNINYIDSKCQLSYSNGMHHTCLPNTPPKRNKHHMSRPMSVSTTQQLNETLFQMTSRRTPTWANTDSPTDWHSRMSSRWSNQFWVEHIKFQHRLNKPDACPSYASSTIFSPEDQMFIEITTLHLYLKSNSSPLREVQISFSLTQVHQIASYELHHQTDAPM